VTSEEQDGDRNRHEGHEQVTEHRVGRYEPEALGAGCEPEQNEQQDRGQPEPPPEPLRDTAQHGDGNQPGHEFVVHETPLRR
jgi:hypothetical protein